MSKQVRGRVFRVSCATALFLVVSLSSPPTLPSVPERTTPPPSPEEIYVLEELAQWVMGRPLSFDQPIFGDSNLSRVVQRRSRSFELFRNMGPKSARRRIVRDLPYGEIIDRVANRLQVDSLLLASVMEAESGFNPYAISPQGALGLMQVMPDTAGYRTVEDLMEPEVNVEVGARYLAHLLEQFDGNLALALASYNAGPGIVKQYGGMPPFPETRRYVDRVLTRYVRLQRNLWQTSGASEMLF